MDRSSMHCVLHACHLASALSLVSQDTRWHELFVEMVKQHAAEVAAAAAAAPAPDPWSKLGRPPNRPADLPVY